MAVRARTSRGKKCRNHPGPATIIREPRSQAERRLHLRQRAVDPAPTRADDEDVVEAGVHLLLPAPETAVLGC